MGYASPYHKHTILLKEKNRGKVDCSHCRLPITELMIYGCYFCDFSIHAICSNLPETIWSPLHKEHPLTLLTLFSTASASDDNPPVTNLCCNICLQPHLEGYIYHCATCQFTLHLRCFFVLNHEKHNHPLFLRNAQSGSGDCRICSYPINMYNSFNFSCHSCNFYIHYDCSFIPLTIKHYHVHELTIRHNFPEECEQVYCDRCEDGNGELDRRSSHYYCQRCDYIAHVRCISEPIEDAITIRRFTHEHPLRVTREGDFCCNQCDYSVKKWVREEYPSLIKHPCHPEHTLTYVRGNPSSKCTNCKFTLPVKDTFSFVYPYGEVHFQFRTDNHLFVCDICGEFGKGSRMTTMHGKIDIHLECYALPGKLEHQSHRQHSLYLSATPKETVSQRLPRRLCNVCNKEIDTKEFIYCCLDCNYATHVTCVAHDLLLTLRSSIKNQPDFCAIIEPDRNSFELHITKIPEVISSRWPPQPLPLIPVKTYDVETKTFKEEVDGGKACCPRCRLQLSIRAKDSGLEIGNQVKVSSMSEI